MTNDADCKLHRLLAALHSLSIDDLCRLRLPERFAAYGSAEVSVTPYEDEAAFARELLRRKGFALDARHEQSEAA